MLSAHDPRFKEKGHRGCLCASDLARLAPLCRGAGGAGEGRGGWWGLGRQSPGICAVGRAEEDPPCLWNTSVPGPLCSGSPGRGRKQRGLWLWPVDLLWQKFCICERRAATLRPRWDFLKTFPQTNLINPPISARKPPLCTQNIECLLALNRSKFLPQQEWGHGRGSPKGWAGLHRESGPHRARVSSSDNVGTSISGDSSQLASTGDSGDSGTGSGPRAAPVGPRRSSVPATNGPGELARFLPRKRHHGNTELLFRGRAIADMVVLLPLRLFYPGWGGGGAR